MRRLLPLVLLLALAGCSAGSVQPEGLTNDQVGLSPSDVSDTPEPEAAQVDGSEPGEGDEIPPAFDGAPPAIPHGIDDFLPITREENTCMMCHADPDMGPVVPESHYVDLRNAPGEVRDEIAGARQVCVSCHVPLTDAPLLRENHFGE
jgi:cytochrome c-type protein NapB